MKNPNQRPSAKEALNHNWFKKYNGRRLFTNFKKEEMKPFIDNLLNFSFSKLHQLVFAFLVHNLTETESIQKILKLYRYFNESGNCKLSKEELKKGLLEFKSQEEIEEKIDNLFKELDADNNGTVEFEEFLRACIDKKEIINDKYLSYAFNFLDKNDRKFLSLEEIISAFVNEDNKKLKDDMINILVSKGYDKNGKIIYELINGNGKSKEYKDNQLIFEGEYINGKRNGKGREYNNDKLIFEGTYLNGKRNGHGIEYNIKFEGEYLNGKRL